MRVFVARFWHLYGECAPTPADQGRCRECGRPLRLTSRTVCPRCLGVNQ
jgi:hypothetical protein